MQVAFMNECKSCEIRNKMFFNVMFSFLKTKIRTSYDIIVYCKMRLFIGAISNGVSKNQRRIWNPLKHLRGSGFVKIVKGYMPLTFFAKKLNCRCSTWF